MKNDSVDTITILGGRGKNGVLRTCQTESTCAWATVSLASWGADRLGHKRRSSTTVELFADKTQPTGRRDSHQRRAHAGGPKERIRPRNSHRADHAAHDVSLRPAGGGFLSTHARIRAAANTQIEDFLARTLDFANQLTGEPILVDSRMTELSGGQTRALLIADATVICDTPIVLLDEVEKRGHPPHARDATAAPAPQDLYLRHP